MALLRRIEQRSRRIGLWPRLALATTAGFVVLFGSFTLLSLQAVHASTERILQERLVIARMAASEEDRLIERGFSELGKATDFAAFNPRAQSLTEEGLMLARTYGRVGAFALGVYFLDEQGKVVLSHPRDRWRSGTDLSEEAHIGQVLATGRRSVSMPFLDPLTGKPAVALTIPILRADGSLQSVLGGLIDVSSSEVLGPLLLSRDLGRTGHAELVDERGVVIGSTGPTRFLAPGEHMPFYIRMLQEQKAGTEEVETVLFDLEAYAEDGEAGAEYEAYHIMAFVPLSNAPWGLGVGGTVDETFAPVRRLRTTLLQVGALGLFVMWGLSLLAARALVRPVRVLTDAAARIASEDLAAPIHATAGGEIGILAESLEIMRRRLGESLERARQWGRELEVRVEERTGELALRNRQLAAVTAVATAANETRDLTGTLEGCLDVTMEQTGMEAGAVRLWDRATGRLTVAAYRGEYSQFPCWGQNVTPAECPCGHAAQVGTSVFLSPLERETWLPPCRAPANHAITLLPLRSATETLGVLYLSRAGPEPPDAAERETLAAVANQLGSAIRNSRLLEELGRVQAQRELERLKSEFISAVSHELRTPLGIIKGYATTLLRDDISVDGETQREFLEAVSEEADKLNHMIEDLLDASRLQAGRLPVDRRGVSVQEILQGALSALQPQLMGQGHPLEVSMPVGAVRVLADPGRIEQVVRNLVDNAARYSDAGSPIQVAVLEGAREVTVSVRDRGDGIPQEEIDRVFQPFYRGSNARRRGTGGTGLGLAICQGIVEAHGGRLWVESRSGEGSTFSFSLPLVVPALRGGPGAR